MQSLPVTFGPGTYKPPSGTISINRAHPFSYGLISSWLMNEGGGSSILDVVSRRVGQLLAPAWESGPFGGRAPTFASGTRVECGDHLYAGRQRGTIIAWVKPSSIPGTQTSIFSTTGAFDNNVFQFGMIASSGKLYVQAFNSNTAVNDVIQADTTPLTANNLFQVAITSDAATWKMYVNATAQSLSALAGGNSGYWLNFFLNSNPLIRSRIGWLNTTNNYPFLGVIDHVNIWDYPLTLPQIQALYRSPFAMYNRDLRGAFNERLTKSSATPAGTLKTFDGLARANIKTLSATAIANIKSYTGLTT